MGRTAAIALMVGLCAATTAACGESTEPLTCELLSDPTNCWASAAADAVACLPGMSAIGVLAPDRASCTFSDGSRVVFDEPLPDDVFDLERLAFTFERNGAECARFVDTFGNRMELTGDDGVIVSELHPGGAFHLHCPDTTYTSDFDLLFTCPGGTAPTDGFDVAPDLVTFSIIAVTTPGELFRCVPEP